MTGCLRPLCGVACRAIQERPDIVVTFMTLGRLDEKITAECDRYSQSNDDKEAMRRRLRYTSFSASIIHSASTSFHRLVNIGGQGFDTAELMSAAFKSFPDYYRKLVLCESILSMSSGDDIPPTIRPTAVIADVRFLFLNLLDAVY